MAFMKHYIARELQEADRSSTDIQRRTAESKNAAQEIAAKKKQERDLREAFLKEAKTMLENIVTELNDIPALQSDKGPFLLVQDHPVDPRFWGRFKLARGGVCKETNFMDIHRNTGLTFHISARYLDGAKKPTRFIGCDLFRETFPSKACQNAKEIERLKQDIAMYVVRYKL